MQLFLFFVVSSAVGSHVSPCLALGTYPQTWGSWHKDLVMGFGGPAFRGGLSSRRRSTLLSLVTVRPAPPALRFPRVASEKLQ